MDNKKHWTQEEIDRLKKQKDKLQEQIWAAEASLQEEKVGYLDNHYRKELVGQVIMNTKPAWDGWSFYLYITKVKVTLDFRGGRTVHLHGISFHIERNKMENDPNSLSFELDNDGQPVGVIFGTEPLPEGQEIRYRIVHADELSKARGCVRTMIDKALELRNAAHAEEGTNSLKKFLREFRKARKETEEKLAEESKNEPEEHVSIP